jgi:class 3 adenylate cyclase
LDTCFKAFDAIIERHGIEKIKTIGDAYMCAGGLPETVPDHALRTVAAALEMQSFMVARSKERTTTGLLAFDMRVGMHSGSVVAGVVGSRKFAYDIWGDTVNLAARMETAGEPGRVNISQATLRPGEAIKYCLYFPRQDCGEE